MNNIIAASKTSNLSGMTPEALMARGIKFAGGNPQDSDLVSEAKVVFVELLATSPEFPQPEKVVSAVASAIRRYRALDRRRGVTIGKGNSRVKITVGFAKPTVTEEGEELSPIENLEAPTEEVDPRSGDAITVIEALSLDDCQFLVATVEGTLPRSYRTTASKRLAKIRRKAIEVMFWKARVLARGDGDVT